MSKPEALKRKRQPEPYQLRLAIMRDGNNVERKAFVVASAADSDRVQGMHLKTGDVVYAQFKKPRCASFHRLAHAIGKMVVANIEGFEHLTPHEALKRLQLESGCGCEQVMVKPASLWPSITTWIETNLGKPLADVLRMTLCVIGDKADMIPVNLPLSMSYDSMDQIVFFETVKGICSYLSLHYWPDHTSEEIKHMAEAMVE